MFSVVYSISALLIGIGTLLIGMGLMGTLLGIRAGVEQFSDSTTGLVMAAYFLGFILGTFLVPRLIRRTGHIRAFAAMASIASTTAILHALVVEPWAWGLFRVLNGLCIVGLYMIIESWLNVIAPGHLRGRILSLYVMTTLVTMALGQHLISFGGVEGFVSFGIASILLSLGLVPVATTRLPEPPPVETPHLGLSHLYTISPLGVVGAFGSGVVVGAFWGMGPLFAHRIGLEPGDVALLMSAVIFGGALLQWPLGHLSDNHDRRKVMIMVCLFGALLALTAFFAAESFPELIFLTMFFYGGFLFTTYGLSLAHVNDFLDPTEMLEAARSMLLLYGIGATIGPLVIGWGMEWLGPRALLSVSATVLTAMALFGLHRLRVGHGVEITEQSDFVSALRTTPVALELDPRTETEPEPELEMDPGHDEGEIREPVT